MLKFWDAYSRLLPVYTLIRYLLVFGAITVYDVDEPYSQEARMMMTE